MHEMSPRDRAAIQDLTRAVSNLVMQMERKAARDERAEAKHQMTPPKAELDRPIKVVNAMMRYLDNQLMHTHPKRAEEMDLVGAHQAVKRIHDRLYKERDIMDRRERAVHAAVEILMMTAGVGKDEVIEDFCWSDVADIIEKHVP